MIQTNEKEIDILTEEEIKRNKYVRGLIVRATTYSDCLCEPEGLPLRIRIGPGHEGVWVSYLINRKSGKVDDIPCRRFKSNNQTINLEKFYVHQQINSLDAEFTRYKKDCKKGKELGIWDHIPELELRKEEEEKITVYRGRKNLLKTMMNRLEMAKREYNKLEKTTISYVDLKQDKVNKIEVEYDNLENKVRLF